MLKINEHYLKLQSSYLFAEIARRVNTFQQANPDKDLIRLGIVGIYKYIGKAVFFQIYKIGYRGKLGWVVDLKVKPTGAFAAGAVDASNKDISIKC